MRFRVSSALLVGLCLATSWEARAAAPERKVLVQDLVARGVDAGDAVSLSNAVCQRVARQDGVRAVCADDLRAMMQHGAMAAQLAACPDGSCFRGLEKAADARFVLSGTLARVDGELVLSLAFFDMKKGQPLGRSEVKGANLSALRTHLDEAVSQTLETPQTQR
jgi:hypothetical protein